MNTAQTAIIVSGAVGLGAPLLSGGVEWLREKGRANRERTARDRDELRSLLDELTAVAYEHTKKLIALELWLERSSFGREPAGSAPSVRPTRDQLYHLNARLVIRRGREDSLVIVLGNYLRLTDDAIAEIDRLDWIKNEPFDYSDEQLAVRAATYWERYEAFVDAAKHAVA